MKNHRIKKKLEFDVPPYDVEAFEKTLLLAKEMEFGAETYRMTEIQSVLTQVKFIPLKVWIIKIIIAAFLNIGILSESRNGAGSFWTIMSIIIPLLCLAGTNEICSILQPNLKGLLMTARYSIRKVILIRLMLFGIIDFLILALSITSAFLLKLYFGGTDLLYVIALYNLMCGGCIYIINHTKEKDVIFICSAWGGALTIMNLVIKSIFDEVIIDKLNVLLLIIILLSIWKEASEIRNMLGGLQEDGISGQQFI